jgi:hypothetical protein
MTPGAELPTLTVSTRVERAYRRRGRRDCAARDRRGGMVRRIIGFEKPIKRRTAENDTQRKRRRDGPVPPQTGADAARRGFRGRKIQHYASRTDVQIRVDAHIHSARASISAQGVPLGSWS